jgi:hypothetical protein
VAYSRLRDGGDLRSLWLKLRDHPPRLGLSTLDSDSKRIVAQAESTPAPSGDTDAKRPPPLKLETKLQGSLGVTVWDGLALELGYTQSRPQPSEKGPIIRTWSTGVSYRSL